MAVVQEHTECPVQCRLTLANGGVVPDGFHISNPGTDPYLEIETSDKGLNGASIDLKFTCVSPLSATGPGGSPSTIAHAFTVRYKDECYSSNVFEPLAEDQSFDLYAPATIRFTVPYSSLACNDVVTSIAVVTPDDALTPQFTLDQQKGLIYFDPIYREQAREYQVVLRSCIWVFDDPRRAPEAYTEVCSPPSQPFTVTLEDPCATTAIRSDIFAQSLSLPQLRSMTVPLLAEMPEASWPWATLVDANTDGAAYGYGLCGPINYKVLLVDESVAPPSIAETDLVRIVTDTGDWRDAYLVFEPLLRHQPGTYKMLLAAKLADFGRVVKTEVFQAIVLDCVATLSLADVTLPFLETRWYAGPATFDVSGVAQSIVQEPACNYDYAFAAYWSPAGGTELRSLPDKEIKFANNVFTIEKCHPIGANTADPECNDATVPYEKTFNLVFRAYLRDANFGNEGEEVFQDKLFGGRILDACVVDELSFATPTNDLLDPPYVLSTTPIRYSFQWVIGQSYHLCPLSCQMTEAGRDSAPVFVSGFSLEETSPFANPSVQVNDVSATLASGDKQLDGRIYSLEISCVSERSQSAAGAISATTRVRFADECWETVIRPPEVPDIVTYLHEDLAQSWLTSIQTLDCGEIYYFLDTLTTDALWPYNGFRFGQDWSIVGFPTNRGNVGTYRLQVDACVEVQGEDVCQGVDSLVDSQFTLEVRDPCEEGTIVTSGFGALVARQLEVTVLDLSVAIGNVGGTWPFYSDVEAAFGKPGICGPIDFSITLEAGDVQELVRFSDDGNALVFAPQLSDAVGVHKMALHAKFREYPSITRRVLFDAEVAACVPTIDVS